MWILHQAKRDAFPCALVAALLALACAGATAQQTTPRVTEIGPTTSDRAASDLLLAESDQRLAESFSPRSPAIEHSAANGFSSSAITAVPQPRGLVAERRRFGPFSTVAVGLQASSLGVGGEAATPLARSLNLRGGMHLYTMAYGFGVDGASYDFQLHLRTGQISVDWFPFHGGFHISPGLVIYKSDISGAAQVGAGSAFQLGPTSFSSSITDPVHGTASLTFSRTVMPSLTFGFSNMIPRSGRHWSMPLEIGAAYMGHTAVQLNLQGTACVQGICLNTNDPTIQQDVVSEQSNLNEAIKRLQAYPILSSGFAYRFLRSGPPAARLRGRRVPAAAATRREQRACG